jgi:hypothetical protein
MARQFTEGFETGSSAHFWSNVSGGFATPSGGARSGAYYASFLRSQNPVKNLSTPVHEGYLRLPQRSITISSVETWMVAVRNGTSNLISLRLFNLDTWRIYNSANSLIASGVHTSWQGNIWYSVELYFKLAGASGAVGLRIDGQTVIAASPVSVPSTICDNLWLTTMGAAGSDAGHFDDVAFNDVSGSVDNSWCGDGKIIPLIPNGVGDMTGLFRNTGSANWSAVNERPHNSDTSYVEGNVPGFYDLYQLTDHNLEATDHVQRIWMTAVARETTTEAQTVQLGIKTGGVEHWSPDLPSLPTSYTHIKGPEMLVNPNTAQRWTRSQLDTLQVGVKVI